MPLQHRDRRTLRNRPVDRLISGSIVGGGWDAFGFSDAHLTEIRTTADLPAIIEHYREAERAMREIRQHLEDLAIEAPKRVCIMCGKPITGRVDKTLCSGRCRTRFYRHRGALPSFNQPS